MNLCRVIIPPQNSHTGLTPTQGTKVVTTNGELIEGVTKLVLIADTNDVWRAELHLLIHAPDISCVSTMVYSEIRAPWWVRLRNWFYWGGSPA